jgi:hypothetical protein
VLKAAGDLALADSRDLERQQAGRQDSRQVGVDPVRLGRHHHPARG